jgi:hypothetical protein
VKLNYYLVAIIAVGMLIPASIAGADEGAANIPIGGDELVISEGAPERVWMSGSTLHVRGQPGLNDFVGTCGGDVCTFRVRFVLNINLNLKTGEGNAFGTFEYVTDGVDYTWGDRVGTFEGSFTTSIRDGIVTINGVAHGTEDFDGMKLHALTVFPLGQDVPHPTDGWILDPPN